MRNGENVRAFEKAIASYVGAKFAIALVNGTATLHTALVALGVKPGDRVAVPPLTMASTTIAVLHAWATPVFVDVDPDTWLMQDDVFGQRWAMPVALYGLTDIGWSRAQDIGGGTVMDAAQTLTKEADTDFVSYSFQASKILPLGEGGMLVTNDEELATRAREFSSLGYRMDARQPRIDPATLKHPTFARHHSLGYNYRMNDLTAARGLIRLTRADQLKQERQDCAALYRDVIQGCEWLTPQHVPDGWTHDYWTYAVATDTPARALWLLDAMERHGGERPYPAWRLTYDEPAFARFGSFPTHCPVAESLQPRLLQFQTNNLQSAERNAKALARAISESPP